MLRVIDDGLVPFKHFRYFLLEKLDPGFDLGIQKTPGRVEGVDIFFMQSIPGQQAYQRATLIRANGHIVGQQAHSKACLGRLRHRFSHVHLEYIAGADHLLALSVAKGPAVGKQRVNQVQTAVFMQIVRVFRNFPSFQVGRRGTDHAEDTAQRLADQF